MGKVTRLLLQLEGGRDANYGGKSFGQIKLDGMKLVFSMYG